LVISKIEKQKKNSKRVSLFVDGKFMCGIYEDTLIKYGLNRGDDISKETLNQLQNFDEYLYAKKVSYDLLSYRLRSIREIKDKLKAKKVSSHSIEKTINHLTELGLLNDEEFARQLIQSNISYKPKGKSLIKQKLYQKGISKQVAGKMLNDIFSNINEKNLIIPIFEKYLKKLKTGDINIKKRKIFSYLAGKGFDFDIINEIIREKLS